MNKKNTFLLFLLFILIFNLSTSSAFARFRTHEISFSYGLVTLDQISDILEDILTITLTFGFFGKENLSFSGAPFLTYHYYPGGKRFGFGPAVGIYTTSGDLIQGGVFGGTFKETNYIFAGELVYNWILKRTFQLYSVAGIGLRIRRGRYEGLSETETDDDTFPTFNLQVLGFRFGKKIGFFGEFGIGYKGGLVLGLDVQF